MGNAPQLEPRFPMHPASDPGALAGDWPAEITAADPWFANPRIEWFGTTQRRSAEAYVEALGTHQDHILLAPATHARLTTAIAETVDAAGGEIELPLRTRVCLATRAA